MVHHPAEVSAHTFSICPVRRVRFIHARCGGFENEECGDGPEFRAEEETADDSSIIELTNTTFNKVVEDKQKHVLVMFYVRPVPSPISLPDSESDVAVQAPWCGHCTSMKPAYRKLTNEFMSGDVVVARLDAEKFSDIGKQYGVDGFPAIRFFAKNNKKGEVYEGERDTESMADFISKKIGGKARPKKQDRPVKALRRSFVTKLTGKTFNTIVKDKQKHVFVMFYVRRCIRI